ncbi:Cytochrome P450 3A5, partial [Araneus ventricosus]
MRNGVDRGKSWNSIRFGFSYGPTRSEVPNLWYAYPQGYREGPVG